MKKVQKEVSPAAEPCPVCNGDCGGANPPVLDCPKESAATGTVEPAQVAQSNQEKFSK